MVYSISTVVDLLEKAGISWAEYQENMPTDGYPGFKLVFTSLAYRVERTSKFNLNRSYSSVDYLNRSAAPYTFYVRKHNPLIIYDSVATVPSRAAKIRNFNDFAADVNASAIPQWLFVTPNMVNDGHDTNVTFMSAWLKFWLEPLLADERFNDEGTLILLTFDENEDEDVNNRVWGALLGGARPGPPPRDDRFDFLHALLRAQHRTGELGPRLSRPFRHE